MRIIQEEKLNIYAYRLQKGVICAVSIVCLQEAFRKLRTRSSVWMRS